MEDGRVKSELNPKAYNAARQAVEYHREQAALDPEAHLPALVDSLKVLSRCLHELSATDAAFDAATEAVDLLRSLAQARPDAFLPELVNSLGWLADNQSRLGRDKEQRASRLEEVAILRKLAEVRPGEFRPALAKTLGYIGRFVRGVEREEALAFLTEAVAIGRQLVAEGLDTYATTLALHLNELSRALSWSDPAEASLALALAEEALEVSWLLYPANPADFHRLVEIVLDNLLNLHQERGSKPEGAVLERINAFKAWRPGEHLRQV